MSGIHKALEQIINRISLLLQLQKGLDCFRKLEVSSFDLPFIQACLPPLVGQGQSHPVHRWRRLQSELFYSVICIVSNRLIRVHNLSQHFSLVRDISFFSFYLFINNCKIETKMNKHGVYISTLGMETGMAHKCAP